jgi:hypothetical protein
MSLSFVSSAVQTGTSAGGFEETAIENKETEAVNRRNAHKPLFEQLRSNQEEDQEKKEDAQREIMRSTCALDDDDVAHLESLQRQRSDRERKIQERTQNEVDGFRAAKALRRQAALAGDLKDDEDNGDNDIDRSVAAFTGSRNGVTTLGMKEKVTLVPTTSLPVIKVKKRKRRLGSTETTSKSENAEKKKNSEQKTNSKTELKDEDQSTSFSNETRTPSRKETEMLSVTIVSNGGGLGGLLSGYGSSSDEE